MKWVDATKQFPPEEEPVLLDAEYGYVVGYYSTTSLHDNTHTWWGRGYRKQEDFMVFQVTRWCKLPKREGVRR